MVAHKVMATYYRCNRYNRCNRCRCNRCNLLCIPLVHLDQVSSVLVDNILQLYKQVGKTTLGIVVVLPTSLHTWVGTHSAQVQPPVVELVVVLWVQLGQEDLVVLVVQVVLLQVVGVVVAMLVVVVDRSAGIGLTLAVGGL